MAPQTKLEGLSLWSGLAVVTRGYKDSANNPYDPRRHTQGIGDRSVVLGRIDTKKLVMTKVPSPNPSPLASKCISAFHV